MKRIIGVIVVVTLFSCSSEQKLVKLFSKHPDKAAELCAINYPPILKYIKGDIRVETDTVVVEGDSIECPKVKNDEVVKVKCPPTKTIYKNTHSVDTVQVLDSALVLSLRATIKSKDTQILDLKQKVAEKGDIASVWRWISVGLIVALLGIIALLIFRK